MTNLDSTLKSRDVTLPTKVCIVKNYGFSSSYVWMWELGHKEGWAPKNWCFRTMVLEETLESPLESKEIEAINPKGNQSWISIGRTISEAEVPILWPPDAKSQLIGKDPDAGKVWGQDEKGLTETLRLPAHVNGQQFGQTLGDGEGQGSLVCCSPLGCKEFDVTEQQDKNGHSHHFYST